VVREWAGPILFLLCLFSIFYQSEAVLSQSDFDIPCEVVLAELNLRGGVMFYLA
jgi:hypothetical protein